MLDKLCWVVVLLTSVVAGFCGALLTGDAHIHPLDTYRWIACIGGSVVIVLLIRLSRRDMHPVAIFLLVYGFIASVISGAMGFYGAEPNYIAVAAFVFFALMILIGLIYLIWEEFFATDDLPNILYEMFGESHIREAEGVHFTTVCNGGVVHAGEFFEIELYMQNCFDKERTVCFKLDKKRRNRKRLEYNPETKFTLPAGAVMRAVIPVRVKVDAKKKFSLSVGVITKGGGGKRIRRWRAKPHETEVSTGFQIFALLGGFAISGGGLKLEGSILPSDTIRQTGVSREVETEMIWTLNDHIRQPLVQKTLGNDSQNQRVSNRDTRGMNRSHRRIRGAHSRR